MSRVELDCSAERALWWASRDAAFRRLLPPWHRVEVVPGPDGLQLLLRYRPGLEWRLRRRVRASARELRFEQVDGPFVRWIHTLRFEPTPAGCMAEEVVEYDLPLPRLLDPVAGSMVRHEIERVFRFRRRRMRQDVRRHAAFAHEGLQAVAVTGQGVVASRLIDFLRAGGHRVQRLSLHSDAAPPAERWPERCAGLDAVVHLATENLVSVPGPRSIHRLADETHALACELARMCNPPRVLLSASLAAIYGDHDSDPVGESAAPGSGPLSSVAEAVELATEPARAAGIRVVHLRLGLPLGGEAGVLPRLSSMATRRLGASVEPGPQYLGWIDADDAVGAILFLLFSRRTEGPVNVVSPVSITAADLSRSVRKVAGGSGKLQPRFLARTTLGRVPTALLTQSTRATPSRLLSMGFGFDLPGIEDTLRFELGRQIGRSAW